MKTHFVLPFPVNYVGECIRTAPYTAADYARWGTESTGSFYVCCIAQNKMESVRLTTEDGVLIENALQCICHKFFMEQPLCG